MKGIFVLAALAAALWLSMPSGSGAVSGVDTSDFYYSFQSGGTWHQPHLFDNCEAVDGAMVCSAVVNVNMPPQAWRLLQCEAEGENCAVLKTFDGEESCHLLIKHGGRNAVTEGCVWGAGHVYHLVAPVGVTGDVGLTYTHEPQLNPDTGKPWPRQQTTVVIDENCRETVKGWREGGKVGPAPECRARTWRYEQDVPLVAVE